MTDMVYFAALSLATAHDGLNLSTGLNRGASGGLAGA